MISEQFCRAKWSKKIWSSGSGFEDGRCSLPEVPIVKYQISERIVFLGYSLQATKVKIQKRMLDWIKQSNNTIWNLIHFSFCASLYDFNTDQFITGSYFGVAIWAKDLSEESLSLSIKPCYFLANLWHWSLMAFLVLSVYVVIWQLDMVSASHELKTDNQRSSLTIRTQFLPSSGDVLSLQLLYIYLPIILFQWDSASHISTHICNFMFLNFFDNCWSFHTPKRLSCA